MNRANEEKGSNHTFAELPVSFMCFPPFEEMVVRGIPTPHVPALGDLRHGQQQA
jgi:hypothetical protein